MAHAPTANHVRFPVDPRDVPASKAARRLHLTESEFREKLSDLLERGFPAPDPTTGMFDLKAIDTWMDNRSKGGPAGHALDARSVAAERIERMRRSWVK